MARKKPKSAFDSWPSAGWFVGQDEVGGDGNPFDWSPPPDGFTAEDAHRWVSRAHALYQYWYAVGWSGSRVNGPSSSAPANAYLLIDDLRRRCLVPQFGIRMFRVIMDDCPDGFEARELGVVRDWLGEVVEAKCRAAPSVPRLTADYRRGTVTLDGETYNVGDVPAAIVHVLLTSDERVSLTGTMPPLVSALLGGMPVDHLERDRDKLPDCVRAAIGKDNAGLYIRKAYLG